MRAQLEDLKQSDLKLHGFYRGVVEGTDALEDVKRGRCRIRVYGVHSQITVASVTEGIPTEELPWAEPVFGLLEGSSGGYGLFCIPQIGSHVFVFFENGNHMLPRYFGSAPAATDFPTELETHYPENIVLKTHGGHLIEVDSYTGDERIRIEHATGTGVLMTKDGDLVLTVTGQKIVYVTGDCTISVSGNCTVTANIIRLNN
jgi:hypothetical protein